MRPERFVAPSPNEPDFEDQEAPITEEEYDTEEEYELEDNPYDPNGTYIDALPDHLVDEYCYCLLEHLWTHPRFRFGATR